MMMTWILCGSAAAGLCAVPPLRNTYRRARLRTRTNTQMVDDYYQRVVYLRRPDAAFLERLYRGSRLLTGLAAGELLDPNMLKAIVYGRIISSPHLRPEIRRAIIAEADFPRGLCWTPNEQKARRLSRTLPSASRRALRTLSCEAAAVAVVLYSALSAAAPASEAGAVPFKVSEPTAIHHLSAPRLDAVRAVTVEERGASASVTLENFARPADSPPVEQAPSPTLAEPEKNPAREAAVLAARSAETMGETPNPEETPAAPADPEPEPEAAALSADPLPDARYYDVALSRELQDYTRRICAEYGFPFEYALAMMFKESSFRASVKSKTNDYGIMQINQCNHGWLREMFGVTDFYDPEQNIRCGVYMISTAYHKYGDMNKALMAYNMGDNGASKLWKQGIHSSQYSRAIVGYAEKLRTTGTLP